MPAKKTASPLALGLHELSIQLDEQALNFNHTDELEPFRGVLGQERAVEALQEFDWGKVRADTADRSISQDDFDAYFGL